jgi:hypothetical protein
MWGGTRTYRATEFPALIDAYINLGLNANKDGKAHQILSFSWSGFKVAQVELEYADPITNASILAKYNAVPNAVADRTGIRSLAELTTLFGGPPVAPDCAKRFGHGLSSWTRKWRPSPKTSSSILLSSTYRILKL